MADASKAGLRPGANQLGAPTHQDLFQWSDPVESRRREAKDARTLGLLCFLFGVVVAFLVLVFNGLLSGDRFVVISGALGATVESPDAFRVLWSDGETSRVTRVEKPDGTAIGAEGGDFARVHLVSDGEPLAVLCAPAREGAHPASLEMQSVQGFITPAIAGAPHAWVHARLFGFIPPPAIVSMACLVTFVCVIPALGIPFYKGWMRCVAAPLGWINSRILLTVMFLLVFVPGALFLRVRRLLDPASDSLGRAPRPKEESYWTPRTAREPQHFRRWF